MKKVKGFTLIELMIVVIIIGILAGIAYPSYSQYVQRGYRTEGKSALLDLAAKQERYYMQNYKYADEAKLNVGNTETGKYRLNVEFTDPAKKKDFILVATPLFPDNSCGAYTLTSTGLKGMRAHKGITGTVSDCW